MLIKDAGVVSKSYPDFWKDLETLGFETEAIIIA
jgi:3-phosphoshikimate 1-carboxyvinyltransferase